MKAASGELNLTVITLIAIAAIAGFFMWWWSSDGGLQKTIETQWNSISGKPSTSTGVIVQK